MTSRTPFGSVLIANRGEIARRIIRTARTLGLKTIAVYSDPDAGSLHVREADSAIRIGAAAPAESYLNIDRVIAAAMASGAEAIHPGYGFLSENPALPEACRRAGIVFIGPSSDAIARMGDKAAAKAMMQSLGLSCIPGYQGEDQREATLAAEADRLGYPVMIKAVAGGGGRGMRLVQSRDDFDSALRSARSEALAAFGNDHVLLEKAIFRPRHIEVQIVADRYGNVIHLGERDCSVQRRHQKLIEEAPAPNVSEDLRDRIARAAVTATNALDYEGVGTLEFLIDESGDFYFMEMNTRLQVEHPVTEAVTGLDLVGLQLKIAAGEQLEIRQEDVRFRGHAIEVRLCAEDPTHNFLPQSGVVSLWKPPDGLRVEHALETGNAISPFYDSMVAKLISHAPNREEARHKLLAGVKGSVLLGIASNRAFLVAALAHPQFVDGLATTDFIGSHGDELMRQEPDPDAAIVAAALLRIPENGRLDALCARFPVPVRYRIGDAVSDATVSAEPQNVLNVSHGRRRCRVRFGRSGQGVQLDLSFDGQQHSVAGRADFARRKDRLFFRWKDRDYAVEDLTYAAPQVVAADGAATVLRASMSGRVAEVHVAAGDTYMIGESMITLEAMKMEHVHALRSAGTVAAVFVKAGDQVSAGQMLVRLDKEGSPA